MMGSRALLVCAGLLAALLGVLWPISEREPGLAGLALLLGVTLLAPVFLAAIRQSFDPAESIYFLLPMYAYVYLVKPVARVAAGEPFLFGAQNLEWAVVLSILGLLAFYLGYYSRLGERIVAHVPAMQAEISRRNVRRCAWAYILIGAAGLWAYMEVSGGWQVFWSVPHGYGGKAELTTAYVHQLPELMVVGFFLIAYDALVDRRLSSAALVRVALASIGGVGVYTVLWSRRTLVAWVLIAAFLMYFLARGRRPGLTAVVSFGLMLFLAVTLTLAFRPHLHLGADTSDLAGVSITGAAATAVGAPGDEFDSLLAVVTLYPERIGYDYFRIYAQIVVHPIPRLIWPDKPPLFVSSWDEFLFQSGITPGASEGLLGDLYIQMGLLGVVIGMFASGVLWKSLFAYLRRAPSSGFMQVLYAVAIGNVPSFVMQSAIAAFWKWMPFMIPSVVLAFLLSKRRAARPSGVQAAWASHGGRGQA